MIETLWNYFVCKRIQLERLVLAVNLSDADARRPDYLQTGNCERCWQKQECWSQDCTERRKYARRISLCIGLGLQKCTRGQLGRLWRNWRCLGPVCLVPERSWLTYARASLRICQSAGRAVQVPAAPCLPAINQLLDGRRTRLAT